jgi:hypothetical protein
MGEWHKSSFSGGTNDCVEVRETAEVVAVRDTQNRERGHLAFPAVEWAAFLDEIRAGRL